MTCSMLLTLAGLGFSLAGILFTFVFPPAVDKGEVMDLAESMNEQIKLQTMTPQQLAELWKEKAQEAKFHLGLSKAGFWFLVIGTASQIVGALCR